MSKVRIAFTIEALGLTDYLDIIKKPMDLGKVNEKITDGSYKTVEECLDDIQLIWDNCKLYNGYGSVKNSELIALVDLEAG